MPPNRRNAYDTFRPVRHMSISMFHLTSRSECSTDASRTELIETGWTFICYQPPRADIRVAVKN
jgi:hypothetical protein